MRLPFWPERKSERRATVLAGLILLQSMCALFFIGDVIEDFHEVTPSEASHLSFEVVVVAALVGGVVFLMVELRRLLARMSQMQVGLDVARGHLAEVIDAFFEAWKLTSAERDVAIMILKGLDNETIAQVRKTAPGTVRAQATNIYAKSSTDGRAQFISLFMEELMAGDITPESDDDGPGAKARDTAARQNSAKEHA